MADTDAIVLQHRRGTSAEVDAFTGAEGEITYSTDTHELRTHDGVTAGGYKLALAADVPDAVTLTGDQTVAGVKTFSDTIKSTSETVLSTTRPDDVFRDPLTTSMYADVSGFGIKWSNEEVVAELKQGYSGSRGFGGSGIFDGSITSSDESNPNKAGQVGSAFLLKVEHSDGSGVVTEHDLALNGFDGTLTWDNKHLVRSVNGVKAADTGDVTLNIGVKSVNGVSPDSNGDVLVSLPTPRSYITETWRNGTSWYRKWSDGWVEQGGFSQQKTYAVAVTLQVPYATSDYTVLVSRWATGATSDPASISLIAQSVTATGFTIRSTYATSNAGGVGSNGASATVGGSYQNKWYACGYI